VKISEGLHLDLLREVNARTRARTSIRDIVFHLATVQLVNVQQAGKNLIIRSGYLKREHLRDGGAVAQKYRSIHGVFADVQHRQRFVQIVAERFWRFREGTLLSVSPK